MAHAGLPDSLADVAVVVPTTLRPSLLRAARSVFRQDFAGHIHLLIGIDIAGGDATLPRRLRAECPPHVTLTILDLGYSTARRHGGPWPNAFGGALRTILSFAARARYVAYLDDNDWYAPMHLALMHAAVAGHDWAFSRRWLVDPHTGWPICIDGWDSVGPDAGINREAFGGFSQPSTLMLDVQACSDVLPLWSGALTPAGEGEDRLVFAALRDRHRPAVMPHATVFCQLNETSIGDAHHMVEFERRGLQWVGDRSRVAALLARLDDAKAASATASWHDAARACDDALTIHPFHPGALRLRAEVAQALGDGATASSKRAQADLLSFAAAD